MSRAAVLASSVATPSSRLSCWARCDSLRRAVGHHPGPLLAHEQRHDLELRAHRRARRRSLHRAVDLAGDLGEHRDDPLLGGPRGAAALRAGVGARADRTGVGLVVPHLLLRSVAAAPRLRRGAPDASTGGRAGVGPPQPRARRPPGRGPGPGALTMTQRSAGSLPRARAHVDGDTPRGVEPHHERPPERHAPHHGPVAPDVARSHASGDGDGAPVGRAPSGRSAGA